MPGMHPIGMWHESGGASPTVSAVADGDTNTGIDSIYSSIYVGARFDSAGDEYETNATGSFSVAITAGWLDTGSASDAWVEFIRTGGTAGAWSGKSNSTRYNLGTTQTFQILDNTSNSTAVTIIGYFRFHDAASGGNVLQTTSGATWSCNLLPDMCPTCCFTPETMITMADGLPMPIGRVKVGDMIRVENGIEKVTEVITRVDRVMYRITFDDDRYLDASEDHPLYVAGKGYAAVNPDPGIDYKDLGVAKALAVGDRVMTIAGDTVRIDEIRLIDYPETVYTFANSKFFANGILVY